ncbi:MAG: VCBS repeat-containing protein [Deltaproteobacteria bacterium]|nr:VCBS repeat-containing protein [Deltaproteobacteria bacterium]
MRRWRVAAVVVLAGCSDATHRFADAAGVDGAAAEDAARPRDATAPGDAARDGAADASAVADGGVVDAFRPDAAAHPSRCIDGLGDGCPATRVAPRTPRPGTRIGTMAQILTLTNDDDESATVEVCGEPDCAMPARSFVATSTTVAIEPPLPAGRWFWRAHTPGATTPWWPFTVADGPTRRGIPQVDLDGDGYADVVVGAPEMAAAYVFHGGCGGPSAPYDERLSGSGYYFGFRLDAAGDVDGDGVLDLLAGGRGATRVFAGQPCGMTELLAAIEGPTPDQSAELAGIGDVDGDGYDDFVTATSPISGGDVEYVCDVRVYYGGASAVGARSLTLSVEDSDPWCYDPWAVAAADADLTMDGLPDIVVARPDLGVVEVYEGSTAATGLPFRLIEGEPGAELGLATNAGDLDCDGAFDLAISQLDPRRVRIVRAAGDPWAIDLPETVLRRHNGLAALGDVDGDGCDDLAITTREAVVVAFGGHDGPTLVAVAPPEERYLLYFTVGGPGDVDGDGYPDLAVGSVDLEAGLVTLYAGGSREPREMARLSIEPFHSVHDSGPMFGLSIAGR